MARAAQRTGVIVAFDDDTGIGTLRDLHDHSGWDFHCTALLDGTRTVEVGTQVRFRVAPGHGGRTEATAIEKLSVRQD